MPTTAAQLKTWVAWLSGGVTATRIPDQEVLVAFLREHLAARVAPIVFVPLDDGSWHIAGRDFRGRVPRGLRLAYEAVSASQRNTAPPIPVNSHAARKAIRTDAVRWARRHCPLLVPVLQAISVERGELVYDRRPGIPTIKTQVEFECVPSARNRE